LLHPDKTEVKQALKAENGYLNIGFPEGNWSVSGVVIQGAKTQAQLPPQKTAKAAVRPAIRHTPPKTTQAGHAITLSVGVTPPESAARVRLYYRPVNQQAKFKMLELPSSREITFTVPGEDVSAKWDLLYYFEVLNADGGGWFHPDPQVATPYYVVKVTPN
jgi:hypothetical protein